MRYFLTTNNKGLSIEVSVKQVDWGNRIRSFVQTELNEAVLWRGCEISKNRFVVAVRFKGDKRETVHAFGGCLVFLHWNNIYKVNSKYSFNYTIF